MVDCRSNPKLHHVCQSSKKWHGAGICCMALNSIVSGSAVVLT